MTLHFQVVFDATDALRPAEFWAAALGYEREDNSALVQRVLDYGAANDDDVTMVDGRLAWRTVAAIRHPDDPVDEDTGAGRGRRILFINVPEAKTVKNRVHLDLTGPDHEAEADRLVALGARRLRFVDKGDERWWIMADPEGNEFCLAG